MGASRDSAKIREEFMMMKQDMKMDTPVRCGRCRESKNPNHFLGGRYAQCVQCRGLSKGLLCTSEHVTAASTPRAITVHNLALAKEAAIRLYVSTRRNSGPAANTRNAMEIVPEFSYEPLLPGHLEMSPWLPYRVDPFWSPPYSASFREEIDASLDNMYRCRGSLAPRMVGKCACCHGVCWDAYEPVTEGDHTHAPSICAMCMAVALDDADPAEDLKCPICLAERREMWQSPALVFPFFRYNKERSLIGRWNDLY
eukprot:jgi/Mesvir1/15337/Mv06543-RA.1